VRVPPTGVKKENFVSILGYALIKLFSNRNGKTVWQAVEEKFSPQSIDGIQAVLRVLMVFAFTPVFWALWDQNLSEWVLQARKLDRTIFGIQLLPEQIQTFNPLFLISMIPVCTYGIFPLLKKMGIEATPLRKIGAGLLLTGLSFIIIALLQESIDAGKTPFVGYQILAYFILAVAEILVSMTCLEYAYTHSPSSMKSTMSALYLLGIAAGNLFVAYINGNIAAGGFFSKFTGAAYFWLFIKILAAFLSCIF